jgi:hypothetical protein
VSSRTTHRNSGQLALVAAILAGAAPAATLASPGLGASDAAQRSAASGPVAAAVGVSDAAQRTSAAASRSVPAAIGLSDAAQQGAAPVRVTAALGVSEAAVRRALETGGAPHVVPRPAVPVAAVAARPAAAGDGFDWGSAAVGAGGGIVLAAVVTLGGAAALRPSRRGAGRPA